MDNFLTQCPAGVDPQRSDAATLGRLAAAFPLIVRMLDGWQISPEDQTALIGIDVRTLQGSRKDGASGLNQDQATRLSLIAGIYQAV